MRYILFFSILFAFRTAAQRAEILLFTLNGDTIKAKPVYTDHVAHDFITVRVNGKEREFKPDSLLGFKTAGFEVFCIKTHDMPHYEFHIKVRTYEEFIVYGWSNQLSFGARDAGSAWVATTFIKRPSDDRSHVYKLSKEGISEMPLNCRAIMDSLLKDKPSVYTMDFGDLDAYERDCGVITRSR